MHTPTKQQVQKVIDTLKSVNEKVFKETQTEAKVNMGEKEIHPCGTPMCHAGYYTVECINQGRITPNRFTDYLEGAELISIDLGFDDVDDLRDWADINHRNVWGNEEGIFMFSSYLAFDKEEDLTLQDIITHWEGVRDRLPN